MDREKYEKYKLKYTDILTLDISINYIFFLIQAFPQIRDYVSFSVS